MLRLHIEKAIVSLGRPVKHLFHHIRIKCRARRTPLRIVVGASGTAQSGWLATDISQLNVLRERDFIRYFSEGSIHAILAEHVWEHLTLEEGHLAASICFKYLKKGGYLRIAVPDGNFPDPRYIDDVKPMGCGCGAEDHKILYTFRSLGDLLRECGFEVVLLEYWDNEGRFISNSRNADEGMIRRSRWHDLRNSEKEIRYTSLIVDAVKP